MVEGAVVSASMGVISPLLAEITILCARMPEGRAKKEIAFFEQKLRSIQVMVSSLHAIKMSHMVEEDRLLKKRWAKQAREIAYDTQDFIDLFRHSAGLSDDTARKTTRRPKKVRLDREMVNKIEELQARMAEVIERHKRFKLAVPSSAQKEDMPSCSGHEIQSEASTSISRCPTVSIDAHLSALYAGADGLVGIDGPMDELTALLMDDKQQTETKVVSILGPEGIGKTTLAKEVYNSIQGKFECCAFVSMSQKAGIQEILEAFRSQFRAQDGASIEACQEERLTHKLIQVLKGKRYFVVLDGVWSTRAWRLIRCALPGNNHGSRILMTTCIDGIAMSCCSTTGDSIYRMKYLPEIEGRRLFIERTFGLEKCCPYLLEQVGGEILRKCGGWPIIILTVASLLASKSSSEEQWKMIQGSIGLALERPRKKKGLALEQSQAHSCDSLQGVKSILYICYNDLPQYLKTCLLYLSIYPEGYVIRRDHLVRRWIAEGFISVTSEHENVEEVGQCYFNELINRGMIQPMGIQYDGQADACQVHNLILSLIVSISAEENFVTLIDHQAHDTSTIDKVRRLSLNYHGQQHFVVPSSITSSPVRSLTVFGSAQRTPILSNSQALRVFDLDVQGDPGKKYLGTIGSFIQLKYLRLQMNGVVELPEQIGELQFLETLDLTETSIRKLPRSLIRLWRLVYLLVCNVELPDGIGDMRSLEELSGIQVNTTNSTSSLLGVGQLTKLRIVQLIWSIPDACSDIKGYEHNLVSSLTELSKLQSLCIESKDGSSLSFLDSWSPHPQPLQKLYLTGRYYFPRIPERIISLVNLDFLDISVYQVEDKIMDLLGSLPALLVLSLSSQIAAPEQRVVVQPGLFHCLTKFKLTCLNSWTGLVIEPAALPKLARLGLLCHVQGQRDPVRVDYSIKYLSSLKNLRAEITFGAERIWEVATRFPMCPTPQVEIWDKQSMAKEEAEIIDKVESLSAHESFEKVEIWDEQPMAKEEAEIIDKVESLSAHESFENVEIWDEQPMAKEEAEIIDEVESLSAHESFEKVEIWDEQPMVKEEAEIIDKVESLSAHKSFEKVEIWDKQPMMKQEAEIIDKVESLSAHECFERAPAPRPSRSADRQMGLAQREKRRELQRYIEPQHANPRFSWAATPLNSSTVVADLDDGSSPSKSEVPTMGGALDALASYVTKMLADMARDEVAKLIGVSGRIDDMAVKLRDLNNFLVDADRRYITDESVRVWVEKLKRAMYLATDIIDLCQLKAMEQGSSKDIGCFNPLRFCMRNLLHAHDIGSRIKELNEKLDSICKRGCSFNFIKLEAYHDRKTTRPLTIDRKTDSLMERSGAVGEKIEEDTRALVKMLTREVPDDKSGRLMVVAIVGVGGIGKTTLCKKVFNDDCVEGKFTKKIWLSITQDFNDVELLSTAITAAGGNLPGGGGARDRGQLVVALKNAIKDRMFFLVLDDMCGVDAWDKLLMDPFSYGSPSSRVVITTRDNTVARSMKAVHYHHVGKLGVEDAWSLLKKQVLTREKDEIRIEILKDIGLQIIQKCDGLPLAVKLMGGLLCMREKDHRAWQKVLYDDTWSVSQMPEEINYAIFLSYVDLPSCLRQCFLHLSLKPKKKDMASSEIIGMWVSEGFVHGNSDGLEELGLEYYRELILRNLIEPEPEPDDIGLDICNMHDVVRSFAQFLARDDALITHNGENINRKISLQRFLRLSIETEGLESDEFEWRTLQEQKSLRSLMLIGSFKIQSDVSLGSFSSLRTLHIESSNFVALAESLYKLKHLRYLALKKCSDLNRLPENIHRMKFLQHISLEGCENFVKLPNNIVNLRELRFLDLDETSVNSMPRGFCALTNLRTLYGFRAHMDGDWCSLEELGPLSNLSHLGLVGLKNVSAASFSTKVNLGEKVNLIILTLNCMSRLGSNELINYGVSEKDQGMIEKVFHGLYPPPSIQDIRIYHYFGRQLPRWMMSATVMQMRLNSLKILMMWDLAYCTQLPDGLCALPCLEYLSVNQAPAIKHVGFEFMLPHSHCHHNTSSQVVAAFARLHKMILCGMVEWEEWEWEENVQAMPALEVLTIKHCKLRCIPPGLAFHARALKKLTIWCVQRLQSVENFASIVELDLFDLSGLTRISNFPKLQKLKISCCRKLEWLQEMDALQRLVLAVHYSEKQLPLYLQTVKPSHLLLDCSVNVLASMALGKSGPEWDKFRHIQHVEAYADDLAEGTEKRWHLFYTSEPESMETNINLQGWEWKPHSALWNNSSDEDEEGVEDNEDKTEEGVVAAN